MGSKDLDNVEVKWGFRSGPINCEVGLVMVCYKYLDYRRISAPNQ